MKKEKLLQREEAPFRMEECAGEKEFEQRHAISNPFRQPNSKSLKGGILLPRNRRRPREGALIRKNNER